MPSAAVYAALLLGCTAATATACRAGPDATPYAPAYADAPAPTNAPTPYIFAIHPLHNPQRLLDVYGPLVDYLNDHLGRRAQLRLEASRSYDEFDQRLAAGRYDFALPNPYQTVNAVARGYRVFAKMGDDDRFRGIILVRRDRNIRVVDDLRGEIVAFPAPTALAAAMMPEFFLHIRGLDVNRDIERRYVGSQESAMMAVYLGHAAAGATWPPPWESFAKANPAIAAELEVRWETPSLLNNSLVARADVPQPLVDEVAALLVHLHERPEGEALLASIPLSRFVPADSSTYAPVREFLRVFSATVRPVSF